MTIESQGSGDIDVTKTYKSRWCGDIDGTRSVGFTFSSLFSLDQEMATKWLYNWSPGLISGAFCTIFRAWPVGTGLGTKFGREIAEYGQNRLLNLLSGLTNFPARPPSLDPPPARKPHTPSRRRNLREKPLAYRTHAL